MVNKYIEKFGWYLVNTGGGCNGYEKKIAEGYFLLTSIDEPSAPDSLDEEGILSLYNKNGDYVKEVKTGIVSDLLKIGNII